MATRKKPSNKDSEPARQKQNTAGAENRGKTRPDVPSTRANKAASGKSRANKR